MIPLVGLHFGSATLTEHDDLAPGSGRIGRPLWGRGALLANLELRLGLPTPDVSETVRVQQWSRRLAEHIASAPRFYSRSYAVDPLGTAQALLGWRDALVDAGWNGEQIPDGGERLATLSELERGAALPAGIADRVRRVEAELRSCRVRPFEALSLAEPREAWTERWRRVYALLEERGSPVHTVEPRFAGSPAVTDLGRLQASLRGEKIETPPGFAGDGSLLVLRAETSWELAHGLALLLRAWDEPSSVVIRAGEAHPLDLALTTQGLPGQGVVEASALRPVLQVLPLAVELAFEPRDPYRVLELLTLPTGPFAGFVGRELASALSESPGIGGRAWRKAKELIVQKIAEWAAKDAKASGGDEAEAVRAAEEDARVRLVRVAEWLEGTGQDPVAGAPRSALLEVAARVRDWLQKRLVAARKQAEEHPDDLALNRQTGLVGGALAQAQAFHEALSHEPREQLDLVAARQLVEDAAAGGQALELCAERAGRLDHVDGPADLRCGRNLVVWWHAVGGTEWRPAPDPWRSAERKALRANGIVLPDPAARLDVEASSWRQAILAAERRFVLAIPSWSGGEHLEPHPIWDEIVAGRRAEPADVARVTLEVRDLLDGRAAPPGLTVALPIVALAPLPLPEARATWTLDPQNLGPAPRHSASSVGSLVGCPLQWVLSYRGGLRSGRTASIPSGPKLNGTLGHRLVEELHRAGVLADPARVRLEAPPLLEALIREEAAVLLRPGQTFELVQLERQLLDAVDALSELLLASGLTVTDSEAATVVRWGSRELDGRLDLLLRDREGRDVVLDLKWGRRTYLDLLQAGLAVQLAVYAAARRLATGAQELPAAAYFSLAGAELLATEAGPFAEVRPLPGPKLSETWTKLEHTVKLVEESLSRGQVPVTGVRRSLPLLEASGVPDAERSRYLAIPHEGACNYCQLGTICGQSWEGLA